MTTRDSFTTPKKSALRKFFEYMGRGATPVDGYYFDGYGFDQVSLAARKPPGIRTNKERPVSEPQVASVCSPRLDKCAPAARGT
jgi:hypothetical protein